VKILIFEYITGGGFNNQELPESLVREGRLILAALLDNFSTTKQLQLTVLLDERFVDLAHPGCELIAVRSEHDVLEQFTIAASRCDAVWPVAPEFDGILQQLCQIVEALGKTILTSPASAVAIAGDKYKTYQRLKAHQIATVATRIFERNEYLPGEWMVKQIDGVGCADSYLITEFNDYEQMLKREGEYIIQPHLKGHKTSLSCLFKQGKAWLVCVNLQKFNLIDKQYQLSEIIVNYQPASSIYQDIADSVARAVPDCWGYVGIDLIESPDQIWVLEINPRLTTSFTGIYAALGINIAKAVLQLLDGDPDLIRQQNRPITINLQQEAYAN
jgi:predicted ATP-grasp superfamily ATP-dependent carboligase